MMKSVKSIITSLQNTSSSLLQALLLSLKRFAEKHKSWAPPVAAFLIIVLFSFALGAAGLSSVIFWLIAHVLIGLLAALVFVWVYEKTR
jgi:fatty acid desaturase